MREVNLEIQNGILARFPEKELSIVHGFSTAQAGNMAIEFGLREEIKKNRKSFLSLFGFASKDVVMMAPQHSEVVKIVSAQSKGESIECDGLITTNHHTGLALLLADCFPVIITGFVREGSFVGLIHAGRKETRLGIVGGTVRKLEQAGADPNIMKIVIGPGIHPNCYDGTNLLSEIIEQLLGEGVIQDNIVVAKDCTFCSKHSHGEYLFFSHHRAKRTGEPEGRFMAFVSL